MRDVIKRSWRGLWDTVTGILVKLIEVEKVRRMKALSRTEERAMARMTVMEYDR